LASTAILYARCWPSQCRQATGAPSRRPAPSSAPSKQQHTAKRIFERLRAEHGYASVKDMLGQIATVAIAEALVFGKKAGLDPKKIFEVVSVSTGNSVQFQNRVPRMLARNFAPGGTIEISYKDQELETGYEGVWSAAADGQSEPAGLSDGPRRRAEYGNYNLDSAEIGCHILNANAMPRS
jgi:NADP-dependent 3-hydroxyisobutyrate dehydrogenase-like protein